MRIISKSTCLLAVALQVALAAMAQTSIVPFGSNWKYLDNGTNQKSAWQSISFNDATWKSGSGKFGYGISDANTLISYGTNAKKKYITTYFRKSVSIADASAYSSYTANVKRDDGVVVYVNGVEVFRNNMPTGTISYTTLASDAKDNGSVAQPFTIKASAFTSGVNLIAVEIHQQSATTPDMAFDLSLEGKQTVIPPAVQSINRQLPDAITTNATSVTYRVTFSKAVTGVDAADFTATAVSGTLSASLGDVSSISTSIYDVTVGAITGDGVLRLDVKSSGTGIADSDGNTLGGGYTSGQTYTIDQTAPAVSSINPQSPTTNPTNANLVIYRTTFSEKVTGVDATDFTATVVSGSLTEEITAVAAVGTGGSIYDVTVSSISGNGELRLDLKENNTGIRDEAGNDISGGYTVGNTFIINQQPPTEPKILYYEGFESGTGFQDMHLQTSTTYGFTVVGNPRYNDIKVGRWELRSGDPPTANGTRAEVLFDEAFALEETWHSFAGYFPSADYLLDSDDEAFNQWHQGSSFGSPMLTFRTENGHFEVRRRTPDGSKTIYHMLGPIIYDQWMEFVIHLKQHLTDGIMQIWINGELKMDYRGPTMFDGRYGLWKMGIYKASWNNGNTTNSTKRVWYVDEVKIGNAASTYESMKPAGNNISSLSNQTASIHNRRSDNPQLTNDQPNAIEVYPTLVKRGALITVNTNHHETIEAFISDVNGRNFYTFKFTGTSSIQTMNLPKGMYFINLRSKGRLERRKFLVTD